MKFETLVFNIGKYSVFFLLLLSILIATVDVIGERNPYDLLDSYPLLGFGLGGCALIFFFCGFVLWIISWPYVLSRYIGFKKYFYIYLMICFHLLMGYFFFLIRNKEEDQS